MSIDMDDISDNLVAFECYKVKGAKTLWINKKVPGDIGDLLDDMDFTSAFAYVNPKSQCFIDLVLDKNDVKVLQAERYGGVGVGANGGGVRCGNTGVFQLKGTGINPLLGDHDDYNHSTGNYSLTEAVSEIINSQVYAQILPAGTANVYGLITTGTSRFKGDPYGYRLPLAIMVREVCIRPAHFLPQPFFKPFTRYKSVLKKDTVRVRAVNKVLASRFENNNAFIIYLGRYLAASANQLAFSKVFRIAHGAYSPSNVCFDGRWLDLTNMTMVPTGTNYAAAKNTLPFLSEPREPINVIQQVVYNYGKYNFTDLNIAPLINYYYEQFNAYFLHYLAGLFGIDYSEFGHELATEERQVLAKYILSFIDGDRQISIGAPDFGGSGDVLQPVIEKLFISLLYPDQDTDFFVSQKSIRQAFYSLLQTAYKHRSTAAQTSQSFLTSIIIRSLRKLYFAPFFYLGRMQKHTHSFLSTHDPDDIGQYIESYSHIAAWLFDKQDAPGCLTLCKLSYLTIEYDQLNHHFVVHQVGDSRVQYAYALDVFEFIRDLDTTYFETAGYNFKEGLVHLLEVLSGIDSFVGFEDESVDAAELV